MISLFLYATFQIVASMEGKPYENFSFDYSNSLLPIAYTTYGNAIELNHKLKLNSRIANRGGVVVLD